jgi:hypothetical protein
MGYVSQCPSKLVRNALQSARKQSYFQNICDHFVKSRWVKYLDDSSDVKVVERFFAAADYKYNINGEIPAIISMDGVIYIVTIKAVVTEEFQKIKKRGGIRKDIVENMVYGWLVEISDGLLIYEDRNSGEYSVFHIKQHLPIIESIKRKCYMMFNSVKAATIPDRPYDNSINKECKSCAFESDCWEEGKL